MTKSEKRALIYYDMVKQQREPTLASETIFFLLLFKLKFIFSLRRSLWLCARYIFVRKTLKFLLERFIFRWKDYFGNSVWGNMPGFISIEMNNFVQMFVKAKTPIQFEKKIMSKLWKYFCVYFCFYIAYQYHAYGFNSFELCHFV